MLDIIFMQVIDMSKIASIAILIVLLARVLLKKFPKFISYALWLVVLFRLLCPISFSSMVSLMPELTPTSYHYSLADEKISIIGAGEAAYHVVGDVLDGRVDVQDIETTERDEFGNIKYVSSNWYEVLILLGQYVWIFGSGVMLFYGLFSYGKIRQKVLTAISLKENIYTVDEDVSPFVIGIFHPKIYLPSNLEEKEREYILLHEQFHIRRLDHIVKILAFFALCIHWFNPLVWLAFILLSKDMEMSCDEAVIKRMGDDIRADYSASLLMLATGRRRIYSMPLAFGEGDTKGRIKNLAFLKRTDRKTIGIVFVGMLVLMLCLVADPMKQASSVDNNMNGNAFNFNTVELLSVSVDITEHYIMNTGDPSNLYYIDENNVLWGCGDNNYGQLGQGVRDDEFYSEMVKMAENVVHVDYSQNGFVIYLTAEGKLYGLGNTSFGALQQCEEFSWERYASSHNYDNYVSEPVLLMENVAYARCGQTDVACLTEDGSVWIWGMICQEGGFMTDDVYFVAKPKKVLENAVLVTGGWFNHAALLRDGTVWTWGYNFTGNCGVEGHSIVTEPTKVAEDVVMVWTSSTEYNVECTNIADFEGEYPRFLENTIIKKTDGSYWICGADVGIEVRDIPYYYEVVDYSRVCTHDFYPIECTNFELNFSE